MISSDFAIELASWALSAKRLEAQIAAENIAQANAPNPTLKSVSFEAAITQLAHAVEANDHSAALTAMSQAPDFSSSRPGGLNNSVALDLEITELSAAEGQYKTIAKALSVKMGMMAVALRSR